MVSIYVEYVYVASKDIYSSSSDCDFWCRLYLCTEYDPVKQMALHSLGALEKLGVDLT